MKKTFVFALIVLVMAATNSTSADNVRGINIDFVTIGNAGNAGDKRVEANPYNCGAVSYNYRISKYEVTNAQWNAFTAAAGAPTGNPSYAYDQSSYWTVAQQPTGNVSWYEAAQFCNYLTSGDKSKGAYQFSGDNSNPGDFMGINRNSAISYYGIAYVIPTEDEWYKAAYFKPDATGYSLYANGTDTAPIASVESNYNDLIGEPWNVGTGTQEQNKTFDMMGNVWELNETLFYSSYRGVRGGSYINYDVFLSSSFQGTVGYQFEEEDFWGFRVVSVPEPCSLVLLGLGGLSLLRKRKV
jgi:formylglycine-generating enzyme required for sulfatase activity